MKELSSRQLYLILILSMLSLKFMALPSLLYSTAGRDGYLSVIFMLTIEFFFFWLFLELLCKYPNTSFKQLLKQKCGNFFTIVFFVLLGLYFLVKTTTAIEGVHAFFKENLFEDLRTIIFVVPMFSILIYLTKKGLNSLGRTLEIVFYIIVIGIVLSIILAMFSIKFENLFPFLENGSSSIFNATFKYNFWFGDFLILPLFMGKIKQEKNFKKKTILIWVFTSIFIILFIILFNLIFNNVASYHRLAISDLAQYSFNYAVSVQIDWLPILLWTLALFYQCALGFWLTVHSYINIATKKAENYIITVVSVLMLIALLIIKFDINKIISFCSEYMSYYSIFIFFIALLFGITCLNKSKKRRIKNNYAFEKNF